MVQSHTFFVRLRQIFLLSTAPICITLALLGSGRLYAQNERWRNQKLDERIKTVTFHRQGDPLSMPFASLPAKPNALLMQFDLIGDEMRDYVYTIEHCNSDWSRSNLQEDEYIQGFREARVRDASPSVNSLVDYIVYSISLPNDDMEWTKSGNYRLLVYDNTDDDPVLVLAYRFFVLEPTNWQVKAQIVRPSSSAKDNTHHEIDFELDSKGARIAAPQTELKAFVLQNGRMDNMIGPIRPNFTNGNNQVFDYYDKVVFPAGKESRFFDMRTFEFRKQNIKQIRRLNESYEVTLMTDYDKSVGGYLNITDANGGFVIQNEVRNVRGGVENPIQEAIKRGDAPTASDTSWYLHNYRSTDDVFLQCDYARVNFHIQKKQELEDADVYIVGAFNDYALLPEYKMDYSATEGAYIKDLLLKQGYYNYEYVVVQRDTTTPDPEQSLEGNWYESRNLYQFLIYYRSLNDRFDRLMSMGGVTSGGI
jgi:hypothetical protein